MTSNSHHLFIYYKFLLIIYFFIYLKCCNHRRSPLLMPRWSGAASRSQGMWGRGKERDCLRGRGGGGEGEGVWLPSRSADYRWRGLRGAVLQVPGASVSSVPHDICSLLRSRGTLWRAHAHAHTSGWESENNKLLLSLPPWFSRSGRHTVALNNSWLHGFLSLLPASMKKQHMGAHASQISAACRSFGASATIKGFETINPINRSLFFFLWFRAQNNETIKLQSKYLH